MHAVIPGLAGAVATLLLITSPERLVCQTPDSTARQPSSARDSAAAGYGDSASQSGVDTSRRASRPDSAPSPRPDSLHPNPPSAPVPTAPSSSDSVLSDACASARAGSVAPGILVVVFRSDATTEERAAALKEAGGAPAGLAPDGGEYVRSSADAPARDVADRLVLNGAVASVSERSCPPSGSAQPR